MPDSNVSRTAVVVALPADLIFGARIRATAETVGAPVIIAKNPEDLLLRLREHEARMVILDLDRRGLAITDTIKQIKSTSSAPLLAYVSHTQEAAIREAREAGADKVIARGAFAKQLGELLKLY
jgi:DNA-binding NarL/FixJ family response regulator